MAETKGKAEMPAGRSGLAVYPAWSRRAGGLSLGVNLFPDGKRCSFDCAYCEVVTGPAKAPFSIASLEEGLSDWAGRAVVGGMPDPELVPVDIAFAGDGEPTLSPHLPAAIRSVAEAKRRWPAVFGSSKTVLITNSTGFLDAGVADILHGAVSDSGLAIWAKLDAGSASWYRRMDRQGPDFARLVESILSFARRSPVVLQSMFCALVQRPDGAPAPPPESEIEAWIDRVAFLLAGGARIGEIQVYTQSRPSPHGLTAALDEETLVRLARRATASLGPSGPAPEIRVFGSSGEIDVAGGPS